MGKVYQDSWQPQTAVGVAWYRPEQWDTLRKISEDRHNLEKTHEEWVSNVTETLMELAREGVVAYPVDVDVHELARWCKERKLPVNSKSRAQHVTEKMMEADQAQDEERE
jgi:hypothetical protein